MEINKYLDELESLLSAGKTPSTRRFRTAHREIRGSWNKGKVTRTTRINVNITARAARPLFEQPFETRYKVAEMNDSIDIQAVIIDKHGIMFEPVELDAPLLPDELTFDKVD